MIRQMMWKAAAIVGLLMLAGCSEAPERDYVSTAHRFGIDVPDGWQTEEIEGDVVLAILGPKDDEGHRPTVHVLAVLKWDYSLDGWVKETKELNEVQYRGVSIIKDETVSPDNLPAAARILEFTEQTVAEGRRQRQLLLIYQDRAYALLATAAASDFENYESQFKKCFDSFTIW